MSTELNVASKPRTWAVRTPSSAETSLVAPANTSTLLTADGEDLKIDLIRVMQVKTISGGSGLVTGNVCWFMLGPLGAFHLLDFYSYGNFTISVTNIPPPKDFYYDSLEVPDGWSIVTTNTIASPNSDAFEVLGFGGAY